VVLYELLVGALPFDAREMRSAAFSEIQRIIREVEPPKPSTRLTSLGEASGEMARNRRTDTSTLVRELRDDLDWITIKAMEKARSRRYSSASELAIDIQRHLRHEPVVAGPPTLGYRFSKFVRRHRIGVAASSAIAAALLIGVVGLSIGLARALDAEELARERFDQAQRDAMTREAVLTFLNDDLLAKASPTESFLGTTVRQLLDNASDALQDQFADQPIVEATLRTTIGETYWRLGEYDSALTHLRQAVMLFESQYTHDHLATLDAINTLSLVLGSLDRYSEAEQLNRQAIDGLERVVGTTDPLTLRSRSGLSVLLRQMGQLDEAETIQRDVLRLRRRTLGDDDRETLVSIGNLAVILRHKGDLAEAESLSREVLDARQRLLGPAHPETLAGTASLSRILFERENFDEGIALLQNAVSQARTRLGDNDPLKLSLLTSLASAQTQTKNHDQAIPLWREVAATRITRDGPDAPDTIRSMRYLGRCLVATGDTPGAIDTLAAHYERIPGLPAGRAATARAEVA
jgi:non-specific serine/threonine protein kinase/serine/threonine-protein kinase